MKRYETGFLAGTFDIFRLHHLNLLMKAKGQCGKLIVGVYTDEAIFTHSGSKPIIPFRERSLIVESIRFVDQVVPLYEYDYRTVKNQYPFDVVIPCDIEDPSYIPTICNEEAGIPEKGQVIGYTTGTYDLFHIGHLNIIRRAKEMCDFLIVGVSTDELVLSYKHRLPLYKQEERMQIVSSLKYVDMVIEQKSLDKMDVWNAIHFNVMFHGDDWKGSPLYDRIEEQLQAVGCKIVYLPHTEGVSSSAIRSHIK